MSKKVNTNQEATTATATAANTTPVRDLKALLEKYPNVSLRKLTIACEISYGWILKCSKKPIAGQPYDPEATNYQAVAETFAKRGIDLETLDWDALNVETIRNGVGLNTDMSMFEVGGTVYLREDNEKPFEIIYKTATHIVIMKEGETEPRAWSHSTFLMKGPVFEPRAINNKPEEEEA